MTRRTILGMLLVIGVTSTALAAPPPPGSEDDMLLAPYAKDIAAAFGPEGRCCDIADGTAVDARPGKTTWQVHFRNARFPDAPEGWVDVPEGAILRGWHNPTGIPIVWWWQGHIRCFAPPGGV